MRFRSKSITVHVRTCIQVCIRINVQLYPPVPLTPTAVQLVMKSISYVMVTGTIYLLRCIQCLSFFLSSLFLVVIIPAGSGCFHTGFIASFEWRECGVPLCLSPFLQQQQVHLVCTSLLCMNYILTL